MDTGWIKLHRNLIDWEWWDDHNASRLLIYLLCKVNYEERKWKGIKIPKGGLVCSYETLAFGTGLSVKQIRTAIKKLEDSGEVTRKRADKGQLVTLVKWDKMQSTDGQEGSQTGTLRADRGQEEGRQRATTKEYKEDKERKEDNSIHGEIPKLSDVVAYAMELGVPVKYAKDAFEYYEQMAWKDKKKRPVLNWKLKIRNNWFKDKNGNLKKDKPQTEPIPPYLKNRL